MPLIKTQCWESLARLIAKKRSRLLLYAYFLSVKVKPALSCYRNILFKARVDCKKIEGCTKWKKYICTQDRRSILTLSFFLNTRVVRHPPWAPELFSKSRWIGLIQGLSDLLVQIITFQLCFGFWMLNELRDNH